MVIVLKLINGETVLGLLALEEESHISIQDPFILEYRVDLKGFRNMVLHRYNQFSNDSIISFKNDVVVTMYYADPDLSDYYYYTLEHSIKYRDNAMSQDIQRACDYIQGLLDNTNNPPVSHDDKEEDTIQIMKNSSNTVH